MKEDKYIIFYFDVDTAGNCMDLDTVKRFFEAMKIETVPHEKLIMLPKFFSHTPWITKEECIKILENELKKIKGDNNG